MTRNEIQIRTEDRRAPIGSDEGLVLSIPPVPALGIQIFAIALAGLLLLMEVGDV